jgi:hypothetical protein
LNQLGNGCKLSNAEMVWWEKMIPDNPYQPPKGGPEPDRRQSLTLFQITLLIILALYCVQFLYRVFVTLIV